MCVLILFMETLETYALQCYVLNENESLRVLKPHFYLKLVSAIFYQICIFSPNDSPSKTMKNVFDFI